MDAQALVEAAATRLWTPEGADALAALRDRGLTDETIRSAKLGFVSLLAVPKRDGAGTYSVRGVTIPWFDRGRLVLLKVRQPDGRQPKYAEVYRADGWSGGLYPGPEAIQPGHAVVIVEGELDALLLGQEVQPLGLPVVTMGSASARPDGAVKLALMACPIWYVASDRDPAGEQFAASWPTPARRAPPPELINQPSKDWTDCHRSGAPLLAIWTNIVSGLNLQDPNRPQAAWEDLAGLRWGGATEADENIIVDRLAHETAGQHPPLGWRPPSWEELSAQTWGDGPEGDAPPFDEGQDSGD